MEKYETIEDVFTHNFEVLYGWRDLLNTPHRMHDAVRYFVAQRLNNKEAISRLYVNSPEATGDYGTFAFPDRSVLWLPDDIFDDDRTYELVSENSQTLKWLSSLDDDISSLGTKKPSLLFKTAKDILDSLASLRCHEADLTQRAVAELVTAFDLKLERIFIAGGKRLSYARQWRALSRRAWKQGLEITFPPELEVALNTPAAKQAKTRTAVGGSGASASRSRRTVPAPQMLPSVVNTDSKILIMLDRQRDILQHNFDTLLQWFDVSAKTPAALRASCDALVLMFQGYGHDHRLPFVIPEIRTYLRELRKVWPYAPFICYLGNSFLSIEALAHMNQLSVIERTGTNEIQLQVSTAELREYVRESRKTIDALGKKAGMTRAEIRARKQHFGEYIHASCGPWQRK